MDDGSIQSLKLSLVRPQTGDLVLVTAGENVFREGKLVSINGAKVMLKSEKNFFTAAFDAVAKLGNITDDAKCNLAYHTKANDTKKMLNVAIPECPPEKKSVLKFVPIAKS